MAPTTGALTVHYNTPELLERLLASVRAFHPNLDVLVVDGSDMTRHRRAAAAVAAAFDASVDALGYNIHHGPGMDHGLRSVNHDLVWVLDTDLELTHAHLLQDLAACLRPGDYGAGQVTTVDRDGVWSVDAPIKYLHPRCMLLHRVAYLDHPAATKHGAPMIEPMLDLHAKGEGHRLRYLAGIEGLYVHEEGGTVSRTGGYHLDAENHDPGMRRAISRLLSRGRRTVTATEAQPRGPASVSPPSEEPLAP